MKATAHELDGWLSPLHAFDAITADWPTVEAIDAAAIPEPARTLLVHDSDMTSTLEDYFAGDVELETLHRQLAGDVLHRVVLLRRVRDGCPVEFGAIAIYLADLPLTVRAEITESRRPLGGILNRAGLPYESLPKGFIRVTAPSAEASRSASAAAPTDPLLMLADRWPTAAGTTPTFCGRCNRLSLPGGEAIADVVEILPPLPPA